jgi:hypothetical protein
MDATAVGPYTFAAPNVAVIIICVMPRMYLSPPSEERMILFMNNVMRLQMYQLTSQNTRVVLNLSPNLSSLLVVVDGLVKAAMVTEARW